jgi:hypothetical protein
MTCDCDISVLVEDYQRDPHWLHCMKLSETVTYMFCNRHRVFVPLEGVVWKKKEAAHKAKR